MQRIGKFTDKCSSSSGLQRTYVLKLNGDVLLFFRALNNTHRAPNLLPVAASALAKRRHRQSGKASGRPKSSTEV